jgi:leucyl-tRNA synthetase
VLHLLYARFWTKVLADCGLVDFREPFAKLSNQGQLLAPDGTRMAKSRGNVITPDSIVASYGADALRIYEMFMAPFDQDIAWSTEGLSGSRRFLNRIWSLYRETFAGSRDAAGDDPALTRLLHQTIRKVEERIESFRLNTMISTLMEFANALNERQRLGAWRTAAYHQALETFLVLLAPAAPHIAEELWQLTGHAGSVHRQAWPAWDVELARDEMVQIPIQINGKLREVIEVPVDILPDDLRQAALELPRVKQHLEGRQVIKTIYVPGKVLNLLAE